jgi:hypothetical protein
VTTAAACLLDALALEQTAADGFVGVSIPGPRQRVFASVAQEGLIRIRLDDPDGGR